MRYRYETHAGTNGFIKAASRQEAAAKLEAQFGAGSINLIDGKNPATSDNPHDQYGWDAVFQAAGQRCESVSGSSAINKPRE